MFRVYYSPINNTMSSKKITRLKTPSRPKDPIKSTESTFATSIPFADLETVLKTSYGGYSQHIQNTLISEINKLYSQTEVMRKTIAQLQKLNDELTEENRKECRMVENFKKEIEMYKEMYELEKHNHQRLRLFYEQREKEWQNILFEYKKVIFEGHTRLQEEEVNSQEEKQAKSLSSSKLNLFRGLSPQKDKHDSQKQINESPKRVIHRLKKNGIGSQKHLATDDEANRKAFIQSSKKLLNNLKLTQKQNEKNVQAQSEVFKAHISHNPQMDELFEKIMRKTYHFLKDKYVTISHLKETIDMIKLKQAKTSTHERLIKTVSKLQFQFQNEKQLNTFCQYIEDYVLNHYKMIRGDLVYNFLIEKLLQCELLALTSNSYIEQEVPSQLQLDSKNSPTKVKNCELLLNSTIKNPPNNITFTQKDLQCSQVVRYSISSLQNLSDLIIGDNTYFQDNKVIDPPTVDVTLR